MGEHRDDEKDLVRDSPIASLSLGQHRDFVFKHAEVGMVTSRKKVPNGLSRCHTKSRTGVHGR